jgi:uncharacterized membrane protein YjjP (DUF1212 family)
MKKEGILILISLLTGILLSLAILLVSGFSLASKEQVDLLFETRSSGLKTIGIRILVSLVCGLITLSIIYVLLAFVNSFLGLGDKKMLSRVLRVHFIILVTLSVIIPTVIWGSFVK